MFNTGIWFWVMFILNILLTILYSWVQKENWKCKNSLSDLIISAEEVLRLTSPDAITPSHVITKQRIIEAKRVLMSKKKDWGNEKVE